MGAELSEMIHDPNLRDFSKPGFSKDQLKLIK